MFNTTKISFTLGNTMVLYQKIRNFNLLRKKKLLYMYFTEIYGTLIYNGKQSIILNWTLWNFDLLKKTLENYGTFLWNYFEKILNSMVLYQNYGTIPKSMEILLWKRYGTWNILKL